MSLRVSASNWGTIMHSPHASTLFHCLIGQFGMVGFGLSHFVGGVRGGQILKEIPGSL